MIAPMHWMKQGIASVALAALAIGCPMRTACAGDPPLDRESPQALLSQAEHAESTGDPRVVAIAHLNVESARALIAAHEEAVDAARRLDALRASPLPLPYPPVRMGPAALTFGRQSPNGPEVSH